MATTEVSAKICTKCNDRPAAEKHQWCRECKAEHQRGWRDKREEMEIAKAFCEGAEAMRHSLVTAFLRLSVGYMYGREVARYIATMDAPRYGDQPTPAPGPQPLPNKTAPDVAAESR